MKMGDRNYSLPSINDLLSTKNLLDDSVNIDDCLSSQNDESLFLMASMVFLQRQLKRKLESDDTSSSKPERTYSDLLLFQTNNKGHEEKFYIRLKNSDKFDSIKQSEINIPDQQLSREQLLPRAKKQKIRLIDIFKSRSKHNVVKQKRSMFGLFKRKPKPPSDSNINCYLSVHTDISSNMNEVVVSRRRDTSNRFNTYSSSSSSLYTHNTIDLQFPATTNSLLTALKSPDTFRSSRSSSLSSFISKASSLDGGDELYVSKQPVRLKRPQSKLSVCMEDESESDSELLPPLPQQRALPPHTVPALSYNNFPDELKANLPPEVLQNIINDMINYLEKKDP